MSEAAAYLELVCRRCGRTGSEVEFKRDARNTKRGYSSFCKLCHADSTVAWQKANPERLNETRKKRYHANRDAIRKKRKADYNPARVRALNLRRLYKMANYEEILAGQNGLCAICHRPPRLRPLSVDHDHSCCPKTPTCGRCNRGLICSPCNFSLHSLDEVDDWVGKASAYLKFHQKEKA